MVLAQDYQQPAVLGECSMNELQMLVRPRPSCNIILHYKAVHYTIPMTRVSDKIRYIWGEQSHGWQNYLICFIYVQHSRPHIQGDSFHL